MKKMSSFIAVFILIFSFVGCTPQQVATDKIKVATSAYALKYFIEQVGGEEVHVTFSFVSNPHHLELTPADAQSIAASDAFFNVEAGDYVDIGNQVRNLNQEMKSFDVSEGAMLLTSAEDHDHDHEDEHDHDHGDEHEHDEMSETQIAQKQLDPHIWLDPQRAVILVDNIRAALTTLKPEKSDIFTENAKKIQEALGDLDQKFSSTLQTMKTPYLLVNHAAYGYLANRYQLTQRALNDAADHSENTQTSMIALDEFIANNKIKHVFVEPNIETNSTVAIFVGKYQLETLTLFNIETPVTESADYFELMEQNLVNISAAVK